MAELGDEVRVFSIGSLPDGGPNDGDRGALVETAAVPRAVEVASGNADSTREVCVCLPAVTPMAHRIQTRHLPDVSSPCKYCGDSCRKIRGRTESRRWHSRRRVEGFSMCGQRKFALKASTSVICVSHAVERFAANRLGCPTAKLVVIANGVDTVHFSSAEPFDWSQIGWPTECRGDPVCGSPASAKRDRTAAI